MRRNQPLGENAWLDFFGAQALPALQRANALHQRFFEGAPDSHGLAHRFHLRPKALIGAGKFLKLPFGNLHHHVINRGLEAGRRLAGNVVGNFIEPVAHSEFGSNFGNRESGGFRGQR